MNQPILLIGGQYSFDKLPVLKNLIITHGLRHVCYFFFFFFILFLIWKKFTTNDFQVDIFNFPQDNYRLNLNLLLGYSVVFYICGNIQNSQKKETGDLLKEYVDRGFSFSFSFRVFFFFFLVCSDETKPLFQEGMSFWPYSQTVLGWILWEALGKSLDTIL
jgi:hypothetical protein